MVKKIPQEETSSYGIYHTLLQSYTLIPLHKQLLANSNQYIVKTLRISCKFIIRKTVILLASHNKVKQLNTASQGSLFVVAYLLH